MKSSSLPLTEISMAKGAADALERAGFSRRTFIKGTGALIVSFSMGGALRTLGARQTRAGAFGENPAADSPPAGEVDSWLAIGSDGTITGSFSNGKTQALGQIALASFSNDNGLQLNGDTDFTPTLASGQAVVGVPGSGELGTLSGGSLELSNVDIATEFANLIVAQRGFEADAKAVTTFDQITQDTIALKQ